MYYSTVHTRLIHASDMYVHVYAKWVGFRVQMSSGTPIFGICLVILHKFHVYAVLTDIHGIYVVYSWIYHRYPTECVYVVYPWIYHVYRPSIYLVYPWIYMVYHLTYIHGIYVVYPWIFLSLYNQISRLARAADLIQCAHVCG